MKKLPRLSFSLTQNSQMKSYLLALFLGASIILLSCGKNSVGNEEQRSFLNIDNGQFNVNVIVVDVTDDGSGPRGSGSVSFDFSGDITGSFSASGLLTTAQTDTQGVGAVITKIENPDFDRFDEVISLLAFNPTGNGKADVFILGSTTPVDSLQTGTSYLINPLGPFTTAVFLNGIGFKSSGPVQRICSRQPTMLFSWKRGWYL